MLKPLEREEEELGNTSTGITAGIDLCRSLLEEDHGVGLVFEVESAHGVFASTAIPARTGSRPTHSERNEAQGI